MKLEYLELLTDSSILGSSSVLATQFKPIEVNLMLNNAYNKTTTQVNGDKDIFNKAIVSLKDVIGSLTIKLGYETTTINDLSKNQIVFAE